MNFVLIFEILKSGKRKRHLYTKRVRRPKMAPAEKRRARRAGRGRGACPRMGRGCSGGAGCAACAQCGCAVGAALSGFFVPFLAYQRRRGAARRRCLAPRAPPRPGARAGESTPPRPTGACAPALPRPHRRHNLKRVRLRQCAALQRTDRSDGASLVTFGRRFGVWIVLLYNCRRARPAQVGPQRARAPVAGEPPDAPRDTV